MLRHFPMNRKDIDFFRCSCAVSDFSQTFLRFVSIFLSVVFPTVSVPFFRFFEPFFWIRTKQSELLYFQDWALRLGLVFTRSRSSLPGSRACNFIGAVAQRAGHMGSGLKDAEGAEIPNHFNPQPVSTCFNVFQRVSRRTIISYVDRKYCPEHWYHWSWMHDWTLSRRRIQAWQCMWCMVHHMNAKLHCEECEPRFIQQSLQDVQPSHWQNWQMYDTLCACCFPHLAWDYCAITMQLLYNHCRYCTKLLASLQAETRWT